MMTPVWAYHILTKSENPQTCEVRFTKVTDPTWTTDYVIRHMFRDCKWMKWSIVEREDGIGFYASSGGPDGGLLWVLGIV